MPRWRCDTCDSSFDDDENHDGDSCNRCEEGTVYECAEYERFSWEETED